MSRNRVAIFLRGSRRTWSYTRPQTLYLFDSLFGVENVDWYVTFWKSEIDSIDKQTTQEFKGRNLIHCELLPNNKYPIISVDELWYESNLTHYQQWKGYKTGYWGTAYLDTLLINSKVLHESKNNFIYDRVFFIRPDIYYQCSNKSLIHKTLNDFEIDGLEYYSIKENLVTKDIYYQTNSLTADIMCSRFLDTHITFNIKQMTTLCPHSLMGNFISRNYIKPIGDDKSIQYEIIRPNILENVDNLVQIEDYDPDSWLELSTEEKVAICKRHNISLADYGLN